MLVKGLELVAVNNGGKDIGVMKNIAEAVPNIAEAAKNIAGVVKNTQDIVVTRRIKVSRGNTRRLLIVR